MPAVRGRAAYAVVNREPPEVFIADDEFVLTRVVALHVVASTPASAFADEEQLLGIRAALLEERWVDALTGWVDVFGITVDGYPDEPVWSDEQLDEERVALEVRLAPIFRDDRR
jgi:hypothetical protein